MDECNLTIIFQRLFGQVERNCATHGQVARKERLAHAFEFGTKLNLPEVREKKSMAVLFLS